MSKHPRSRGRSLFAAVTAVTVAWLVLLVPSAATAQERGSSDVPPGKAWVRVGHFVPGMGAVTIDLTPLPGSADPVTLAAGEAGDAGAVYGSVSAYEKLAPGSYTATVRDSSSEAGTLLSRSFEVVAGQARTIAVLGSSDQPRLALLTDDLTPPAPGTARVRLLAASEQADAITVKAVDGPTVAEGAVLGQATPYATVPAGSWTLQLESSAAGATLQDVEITSGSVYTVVALDAARTGVELQVVTDAAGAVVAPKGGAKTGGGGTAVTRASSEAAPDVAGELWAALLSLVLVGFE